MVITALHISHGIPYTLGERRKNESNLGLFHEQPFYQITTDEDMETLQNSEYYEQRARKNREKYL